MAATHCANGQIEERHFAVGHVAVPQQEISHPRSQDSRGTGDFAKLLQAADILIRKTSALGTMEEMGIRMGAVVAADPKLIWSWFRYGKTDSYRDLPGCVRDRAKRWELRYLNGEPDGRL